MVQQLVQCTKIMQEILSSVWSSNFSWFTIAGSIVVFFLNWLSVKLWQMNILYPVLYSDGATLWRHLLVGVFDMFVFLEKRSALHAVWCFLVVWMCCAHLDLKKRKKSCLIHLLNMISFIYQNSCVVSGWMLISLCTCSAVISVVVSCVCTVYGISV